MLFLRLDPDHPPRAGHDGYSELVRTDRVRPGSARVASRGEVHFAALAAELELTERAVKTATSRLMKT